MATFKWKVNARHTKVYRILEQTRFSAATFKFAEFCLKVTTLAEYEIKSGIQEELKFIWRWSDFRRRRLRILGCKRNQWAG